MADIAHEQTDKLIDELDKKLNTVYSQASKEMQEKLDKYIQGFETKDKAKLAEFKSGKITKQEYNKWKLGQVKIGEKWTEMRDTLASDMTSTNQIAASLINGHKPTVYALNHSYSTFQLEKDSLVDTSYTLYSHEAVENLIKNEPNLLPKNKINVPKDKAWNRKKIDNAVTQGILQGESLKDVSGRLKDVTDMNQNAAVRNARTAMTGAQNAGRIDAYKRAKDMGMSVKKVWLATLDGRTRHSHRTLDGETIDIDEKFSNGLRFPGDADGVGSEVYNCRCTLLGQPKGIDYKVSDLTRRDDKLDGMSYKDWKNSRSFGLADGIMPDANITNAWAGKKYGYVYNLMKNSTEAGHGADANNFYYTLKGLGEETGIGKPPQVWAKYLAGELDDDQVKKIEDILTKYLPNSTVKKIDNIADSIGDHAKFLASFTDDDVFGFDFPGEAFLHIEDNAEWGIGDYWKQYLAGNIDDPKLDEILGFKNVVTTTDKIDDIADAAKEAEAALKIPKGNPMTKEQADNYKVNVFYDKTEATLTNCQTNAFAYECRCQGYDVVALPKDKISKEIFDLQDDLSTNQSKAWINKITGEPPEHELDWWAQGKKNPTNAKMLQAIDDAVGNDGERYAISLVNNSGKSAHIVNIDRDENGLLRIIDNQRGPLEKNTWVGDEVNSYLYDFKTINYLIRQDDCVPNPEYFNKILTSAAKAKPDLPASASSFVDYSKLNKFVKDNNLGETSEYYKKWKYGLVGNDDLDNLLKDVKVSNNKISDVLEKYKDVSIWDDNFDESVLDTIQNKVFKSGQTYDEYEKAVEEYWEKYKLGKIKDTDIDKLLGIGQNGSNLVNKTDNIIDDIKKTLPKGFADMDDTMSHDVIEIITPKAPGIKGPSQYYKKWLNNEIVDTDLDSYFKVPTVTPKSATSETINVLEAVKNKKVSTIWGELKAEGGNIYNQWWKTVGDIGKSYDKKQSATWDLYLEGKLKDDEKEKIENFLLKHYLKKSDDVIDYSEFGGKEVYDTLKKYDSVDNFLFYAPADEYDKIAKLFHENADELQAAIDKIKKLEKAKTATKGDDVIKLEKQIDKIDKTINDLEKNPSQYKFAFHGKVQSFDDITWNLSGTAEEKLQKIISMGAKPTDTSQKLVDLLDEKQNLKSQIFSLQNSTKTVETKSDELIKAEAKLKKAQDELKKYQNKTYSGIWADDVSLAEYVAKEDKIAAKKQYFEDKINELKSFKPGTFDYMYFGEKEGIEKKIAELQKHIDDLNDFEIKGKEYAKLQKEVTRTQQEVQKYAPSPFSNSYSQERKDAALWPKSRQEADSLFIAHSRVEWDAAKPAERNAIREYTQSYHKYNEPLRGIQYGTSQYKGVGKTDLNAGSAMNGKKLNAMTDYLDKCSSEHDQWLQRGCHWPGMDKFLQIDMNKLQYGTEKELQDTLLGKTITEYGFMSAGTAKGKGFSGDILFNIFAPKGTKMSYAELYSHFKGGSEVETIIQQGSQFIITKVEKTNGQIYIDIELVNQLPPQRWVS